MVKRYCELCTEQVPGSRERITHTKLVVGTDVPIWLETRFQWGHSNGSQVDLCESCTAALINEMLAKFVARQP